MGDDFLTTKSLSKKMRSKGLAKLRFYCQMCQKQCRDSNGFKSHCMSDSHLRQMSLFAENAQNFLSDFSERLKTDFLDLLKYHFPNKRILANTVYQEYINNPDHVHMNSTMWDTLTSFVQHLHSENLVFAEETEKGWYITYGKTESVEPTKRKKVDLEEKELMRKIEVGKQLEEKRRRVRPTDLDVSADRNVGFVLSVAKPETKLQKIDVFKSKGTDRVTTGDSRAHTRAIEEILNEEKEKRDQSNRRDHWLAEGLIVKITSSSCGEEFKNQKGLVNRVVDLYGAEIETEEGNVLTVGQDEVETVIPRIGGSVMVVNGAYRESMGRLEGVDQGDFSCRVMITSGPFNGVVVSGIKYDDVCKVLLD